jgi:hypothetical protein
VVPFSQVSPPKFCMHLSFPPYVLHAPLISLFINTNKKNAAVVVTIFMEVTKSWQHYAQAPYM